MMAGTAHAQTFAPLAYYSAVSQIKDLALVDVNGDGRRDIIAAGGGGLVRILLGTGSGSFSAATSYSTGVSSGSYGVAVADVTGDGKPDIVAVSNSAAISVLPGTGTGAFSTASTYTTGNTNLNSVTIADVNADGKADILAADNNSSKLFVLLGTGAGAFSIPVSYGLIGGSAGRLAVADVNSDGKLDAVVSSGIDARVGVLLGNGAGAFSAVSTYATGGNGAYGLVVADVNTDSRPDLVVSNNLSSGVGLLLGTSSGTLGPAAFYQTDNISPTPLADDAAVADITGDGKLDIIATNGNAAGSGTVGILPGAGNGTFGSLTVINTGAGIPGRIVVADVNGDNKPDIIMAISSVVGVLLNTTPLATRAALPGASATLYPNPAATSTTLTLAGLPATVAQVQATLLDATGRAVSQQVLAATQGSARAEVPTAGLAGGLYVVRLAVYDGRGELAGSLPAQRLSVR